ncbi:MAG: FixH family protein [Blastocatellia bacterium]
MSAQRLLAVSLVLISALIAAACSGGGASDAEKAIKSTASGDLTVTLSNSAGQLKNGENDLFIAFIDASGNPIDVGAASLNFQMAAMGTMPEMNSKATLTTTEVPGKYHATVGIGMSGTWEAIINYEGPHGSGQTRMTVNVK